MAVGRENNNNDNSMENLYEHELYTLYNDTLYETMFFSEIGVVAFRF